MHDPPLRKFRHMRAEPMFATYLDRWALTPDGAPIATHSSDLLPVRHDGVPAMLKIARGAEEKWGGGLMVWWDGDGAARVIAHADDALLLERAEGGRKDRKSTRLNSSH